MKTRCAAGDAVGVLRVVGRGATGGSPGSERAFNAVAAAAQRYRTLRRRLGNEGARGQPRVRAAVPAVVRRHEQAALDLSAARRCDRCVARRCVGISGRHASVEGVQLRPPRRDALYRATGRRFMALRGVRVEQEGTDAVLAADDGAVLPISAAPGGRYTVPSRSDCPACHEGPSVPVLGFSALQVSTDRDPLAPHAEPARNDHANLSSLVASGRLRNLPHALLSSRRALRHVADRACGAWLPARQLRSLSQRCRCADGLELVLAQQGRRRRAKLRANDAVIARALSRFRPQGAGQRTAHRARWRHARTDAAHEDEQPLARMPPLGVQVDAEGVALVERWINQHLSNH